MASFASRSRCRAFASPIRRSMPPSRSPCSSRLRRRAPSSSPFPSWDSRPTPATTCSTSARCSKAARRRWRASPRRPGSAASSPSSACPCASSTGSSTAPSSSPAAGSSASFRRPICPTTASSTRRASSIPATPRSPGEVRLLGERCPVRLRPAVQGEQPAAAGDPLRDLRGRLGADPAVELRRARGSDRPRQPLGLEHHDRQGRLPPSPGEPAVGALPRRLPVHVGRPRRVDDRPRLGRAGADLRERRPAGAVGALRRRLALHQRRRRPRPRHARAHAPELVRRLGREAQGTAGGVPQRRVRAAAADGAAAGAAAPRRPLSLRSGRPGARRTSAAARSTTSRCWRWCSVCRRPASPSS